MAVALVLALVLALVQEVKNIHFVREFGIKVVYNVYIYTLYTYYFGIGIFCYNGCAGFGQQFW